MGDKRMTHREDSLTSCHPLVPTGQYGTEEGTGLFDQTAPTCFPSLSSIIKERGGGEEEEEQLKLVCHLLCDRNFGFSQQSHFTDEKSKASRSFTGRSRSVKLFCITESIRTPPLDSGTRS